MKVRWCAEKNRVLKFRYGISSRSLMMCRLIGETHHPARANQKLMLYERNDYVWVIPLVFDDEGVFLKTFFPSRKYTRLWKEGRLYEEDQLE